MAGNCRRQLSSEAIDSFQHLKIVQAKPFVYNVQMNREKKLNALNTIQLVSIHKLPGLFIPESWRRGQNNATTAYLKPHKS